MEIRQLQYFVAVAEQLNFTKAADALYVTQPLLSQKISELEFQLGTKLFTRNKRSVQLTAAGHALLPKAYVMIDEMESLKQSIQRATTGQQLRGMLRIGFEQIYERTSLTQAIVRFRSKYPDVEIILNQYNLHQIIKALGDDKIDLGFTMFPNEKIAQKLRFQPIYKDNLCIVASQQYAPTGVMQEFLTHAERYGVNLLERDPRGMNSVLKACISLNISPQFYFYESIATILMHVESGMGVSILPKKVVETFRSPYLRSVDLSTEESSLCRVAVWNKANASSLIPLMLSEIPSNMDTCPSCPVYDCVCKDYYDSD